MSKSNLREALFENYRAGQGAISSGAAYDDTSAQWAYYDRNYCNLFRGLSLESNILEVGPGPGNLLSWLKRKGFQKLNGIDASPGDVEFANKHLGAKIVHFGTALEFLRSHPNTFDAVIMKAMLEHQPKEELFPLLRATAEALTARGIIVIDVPNMDWLLGGHERYMDLTHEVGFTRESLRSLLGLAFEEITIYGSIPGCLTRSQRWFRKPVIGILRRLFYILGEGASDVLFESRSIIAIARAPKSA